MSLRLEGSQELRYAFVWPRKIAVMRIVIRHEMGAHTQDILFRAFRFRQSPTDEVIDPVTHFRRILLYGEGRVSCLFQGIVARITQVVNRIEQRSVQIKNNNHCFSRLACIILLFFFLFVLALHANRLQRYRFFSTYASFYNFFYR